MPSSGALRGRCLRATTRGSISASKGSTVAYKVVFIIIAVSPAVRSTCFDDGPARLAGMVLDGGKKVVKRVEKLPNDRRVHG